MDLALRRLPMDICVDRYTSRRNTDGNRRTPKAIRSMNHHEPPNLHSIGYRNPSDQSHTVYLPKGTIYALTGPARWEWSHGIEERMSDYVLDDEDDSRTGGGASGREILRDTRVSITFRWLKSDGADGDHGLVLSDMAGEGDWNVRGD